VTFKPSATTPETTSASERLKMSLEAFKNNKFMGDKSQHNASSISGKSYKSSSFAAGSTSKK